MKSLIDAHLPPSLRGVFQAAGHDAFHMLDLPERNASRDGILNEVSAAELRVVVTKDTNFTILLFAFVARSPVETRARQDQDGESRTFGDEANVWFEMHLPEIEESLQSCRLVELDQQQVSVILYVPGLGVENKPSNFDNRKNIRGVPVIHRATEPACS